MSEYREYFRWKAPALEPQPLIRAPFICLLLVLLVPPSADAQTTTRVSVSSAGTQANGPSWGPAISADGRFVAFTSAATNLVAGRATGPYNGIFVHDLVTGSTVEASVAFAGGEPNGHSSSAALSADGRFVAFYSDASNLVPGDTNQVTDVFVRDLRTGQTSRVSVAADGTEGNGAAVGDRAAAISADGRFVAFVSNASNLVPQDTNGVRDVFVHDRVTGQTIRASINSDGTQNPAPADGPAISADGRQVAFTWSPYFSSVFVHDLQTGSTANASLPSCTCSGTGSSAETILSPDGRFVAYSSSYAFLIPGDTNQAVDVVVDDLRTNTKRRANVTSAGAQSSGDSVFWRPTLSTAGRYVAFQSFASDLVAGDTNNANDIFLHDFETGITSRVSVAADGSQAAGNSGDPAISSDGRFVAFASDAGNLVPGDTNAVEDIFVRDLGRPAQDVLDHFDISQIASPQAVGMPFSVTVAARGRNGNPVYEDVDVTLSANLSRVAPIKVSLQQGTASVALTLDGSGSGVVISAFGSGVTGQSNAFDVTGGAVTTGSLAGIVQTATGSAVANAAVLLSDGAITDSRTTDGSGAFAFSGKTCKTYSLWALTGQGVVTNVLKAGIPCGRTVTVDLLMPGSSCNPTGMTPILLLPGILGSAIPESMIYPELPAQPPSAWNDRAVWGTWSAASSQPAGMLDPFRKVGWRDLVDSLQTINPAYAIDCTIFPVPYDWRMSADDAVQRYLIPAIDFAKQTAGSAKVDIIAHSMGGLLARAYVQSDMYANRNDVDRLALVGTPNLGSAKAYLMWQGGDPLAADRIAGDPIHFYTETSQRLFWRMMGRSPSFDSAQVGQTPSFYQDMAYLYHTKVPSVLQLEPTWAVLDPNGRPSCPATGNVGWSNDWLDALNSSPNRSRMVPESGPSGGVKTKIFAGTGLDTIYTLPSAARNCGSSFFPDGRPRAAPAGSPQDVIALAGDGTVPLFSAYGGSNASALGATVSYLATKSAEHSALVKAYKCDIVTFLLGNVTCTDSTLAAAPKTSSTSGTLSVAVAGRPQPYVVAPDGGASGINPMTGERQAGIIASSVTMQSDFGLVSLANAASGNYSVALSSAYQEDYALEIAYLSGEASESVVVTGFYSHPATVSFSFDPSASPRIRINTKPAPPTGLRADAFNSGGRYTNLAWDIHPDPQVTGYNIYGKLEVDPRLAKLGTTAGTTFNPGHHWADSTSQPAHVYAVSALYADGSESFLSATTLNNDRDHDGLSDVEEARLGTNPDNPDTDGDGLTDGQEVLLGTNPLSADTDGDGISDLQEVMGGSDPLSPASIPGLKFFTLLPCRPVDTRRGAGPLAGPALQSSVVRWFSLTGTCGIPKSARALSVNVTVVGPTSAGFVDLFPGDITAPVTSILNFSGGQTRSNNAIVPLSADAGRTLAIVPFVLSSGQVDLILDVNGYFGYVP